MADQHPVHLTPSGPPETVISPEPNEVLAALDEALAASSAEQRAAVAAVAAAAPSSLACWAALGSLGRDPMESYACYRVGYHRGLDRLRASGWRGSGYVRWQHPENRGFLRCLAGLARVAAVIGEVDEAERCELFCRQLDPAWPPADLAG